jgi:hypothetical protein
MVSAVQVLLIASAVLATLSSSPVVGVSTSSATEHAKASPPTTVQMSLCM